MYKTVIISFYRFLSIWSNNSLKIFINQGKLKESTIKLNISCKEIEECINAIFDLHLIKYKINDKEYLKIIMILHF
jgi:hypothetical protein